MFSFFFFFKQKTAYEMVRSDWSSDVCSSDLVSFKSLELVRERFGCRGARVLIYGADDGGELTLRELRNHAELGLRPVCFVDDDTRRHGAEIHGVPIVAGFDSLAWVVNRYRVDKIVIGTRRLGPEAVALIQTIAEHLGVDVAEVKFDVS